MRHLDPQPFQKGPSLGTRIFLLSLCSVLLLVLDHREGHLKSIRQALAVAVYPIRAAVDFPFSAASWLSDSVTTHSRLVSDNERLHTAQLTYAVRLQRFQALEAENARLRALLDSSAKVADRILVAEIMAVDLDRYRHRVVIDRGARDGAYEGQALVDAMGIVGQITRAEPFSSEAILISDASHGTPVEVNRNGLRTIAVGTGDVNRQSLPYLPNNADIEPGDLLVSSGLGGAFPSGYPVARIIDVVRDPGEPFARVAAEPVAALNRIREVLMLWSGSEGDQPQASPAENAPAEDSVPEAAPAHLPQPGESGP